MMGCKGYMKGCACDRCIGLDDEYRERTQEQLRNGEEDWSWVDETGPELDESDPLEEYYQDLASASGYIRRSDLMAGGIYRGGGQDFNDLARTSEQLRADAEEVPEDLIAEAITGVEDRLDKQAKFEQWCRENERE